MGRPWILILVLAVGGSLGYWARADPGRPALSERDAEILSKRVEDRLSPSIRSAALYSRVATRPAQQERKVDLPRDEEMQEVAAPVLEEVDPDQLAAEQENLERAQDLLTVASEEQGVWTEEDGRRLDELWPQLSPAGQELLADGLMAAINVGGLAVDPDAYLP